MDPLFIVFLATSALVILTPGQDMVLVMSRSIALGTRAGVTTAAGVSVGLLGHTLLAALGLGAVLQASELVFNVMEYVGAAYLCYLGFKTFRAAPKKRFGLWSALESTPPAELSPFYPGDPTPDRPSRA